MLVSCDKVVSAGLQFFLSNHKAYFAQFEGSFPDLFYCINRGKCKRCLIRDLAFSGDVKLV